VSQPSLGAVFGGGGFFGIAYGLGVAHGLRAGGIDLSRAPALGTSAGVWVASAMAHGIGYDEFDALPAPSIPDLRRGLLAELAATLFGDDGHDQVAAVAVRARDGRRRVLRGSRFRLADLCAASSAVPGVYAPHKVGRRWYVDGGVRSGASVDAGPGAEHLIAVVPLGRSVLGVAGRGSDALLGREVAGWRRRHPGAELTVIRPNRAIAGLAGLDPRNLFDADRAKGVYPLAVEQGERWAARIHDRRERPAA
jgi:NTE family protein